MQVDSKVIEHLAKLSRLQLDEHEKQGIKEHLAHVLDHLKKLDSVDVSAVSPTAHILPYTNVLREDIVGESTPREEILSNAPESNGEGYIVPKVIE